MSKAYRCDRCKKFFEGEAQFIFLEKYSYYNVESEFCQMCGKEIMNYSKNGEKKERREDGGEYAER